MGQERIDEAYALSQRLFALWSATEWPRFDGRVYRVFRRAANRAVRRMGARAS